MTFFCALHNLMIVVDLFPYLPSTRVMSAVARPRFSNESNLTYGMGINMRPVLISAIVICPLPSRRPDSYTGFQLLGHAEDTLVSLPVISMMKVSY